MSVFSCDEVVPFTVEMGSVQMAFASRVSIFAIVMGSCTSSQAHDLLREHFSNVGLRFSAHAHVSSIFEGDFSAALPAISKAINAHLLAVIENPPQSPAVPEDFLAELAAAAAAAAAAAVAPVEDVPAELQGHVVYPEAHVHFDESTGSLPEVFATEPGPDRSESPVTDPAEDGAVFHHANHSPAPAPVVSVPHAAATPERGARVHDFEDHINNLEGAVEGLVVDEGASADMAYVPTDIADESNSEVEGGTDIV